VASDEAGGIADVGEGGGTLFPSPRRHVADLGEPELAEDRQRLTESFLEQRLQDA